MDKIASKNKKIYVTYNIRCSKCYRIHGKYYTKNDCKITNHIQNAKEMVKEDFDNFFYLLL